MPTTLAPTTFAFDMAGEKARRPVIFTSMSWTVVACPVASDPEGGNPPNAVAWVAVLECRLGRVFLGSRY